MKSFSPASLSVPGESGREFWQVDSSGSSRQVHAPAASPNSVFAIEATALDSVPFWVVAPEEGAADVAGVAALKWESLGHEDTEGKSWVHWNAGESERRVLAASVGFATEGPALEPPRQAPAWFEISPRLYPIPDDEAAIWLELGRYVVAFMRGSQLVHFCTLSVRELSADAVREIRDVALALEVHGFITHLAGVRLWTAPLANFVADLQRAVGARVRLEDKPPCRLLRDRCALFPPEIARKLREAKSSRRRTLITLALVGAYVAFFAAWGALLTSRERGIQRQLTELERRRPEAEKVIALQTRWRALEPATNVDAYPAEIFHRVASLLPPEGIRLNEFHVELKKLFLSGEASTVGHAKKFQEDLTTTEGLRQYTWTSAQPTIHEDNRASFNATGVLSSGGETHATP